MSVNCCLTLSGRTRHQDVLNALAALAGNVATLEKRTGYSAYEWPAKAGVKVQNSTGSYGYCWLHFATLNDPHGYGAHSGMYHFEHDDEEGSNRFLYVSSTCWWIAACIRLAQMFGGSVVPSDYNDEVIYSVPFSQSGAGAIARKFHAEDNTDPAWHAMQELTYRAHPLTYDELKLAEDYASYKVPAAMWSEFRAKLLP